MLEMLNQPRADEVRPCPGCVMPCAAHESLVCACGCGQDCPDAPRELSSDPERYPIEAAILPLVFELTALGIVQPCWSCEGHSSGDRPIAKLPSVWFYADSPEYAVLVHRYLVGSYARRLTSTPWMVALTFGGDDPAFTIRPDLWAAESDTTLESLQVDVVALARDLREGTHHLARNELSKINRQS